MKKTIHVFETVCFYGSHPQWRTCLKWIAMLAIIFLWVAHSREHHLLGVGILPFFLCWSREHHTITRRAIEILPLEEQEWLEPEKELLADVYCLFPDWNWPWYGEWGGEPGYPNMERLPDLRREWDISYYCGWDPLNNKGILYPPGIDILPPACPPPAVQPFHHMEDAHYCPQAAYWAPKFYLEKVVKAMEEGRFSDGIRFLGALLHHVEDRGAFTLPELHMKGHVSDLSVIQIKGYFPVNMGDTAPEIAASLEKRMRAMVQYQIGRIEEVKSAHRSKNVSKIDQVVGAHARECCKVVADTIHSVARLMVCHKQGNYWGYWIEFPKRGNPVGLNLVDNPSFERDDGSGYPAGWVIGWHNLKDKFGQAVWDWSRKHSVFSKTARSGEHSVKLMWTPKEGIEWRQRWPVAVQAAAGEKYRCSGWIKTQEATGQTYFILYMHQRNNKWVKSFKGPIFKGTRDWTRVEFNARAPVGVEKMRMACRSDGNKGAAWFDDVEIVRIES